MKWFSACAVIATNRIGELRPLRSSSSQIGWPDNFIARTTMFYRSWLQGCKAFNSANLKAKMFTLWLPDKRCLPVKKASVVVSVVAQLLQVKVDPHLKQKY